MKPDDNEAGGGPAGGRNDRRRTVTTRVSETTRTLLEEAAAESGRSLAQEIELRLERSFRDEALALQTLAGSSAGADIFREMAAVAARVSREMGKQWAADYIAFAGVRAGWNQLLDEIGPYAPAADVEAFREAVIELREIIKAEPKAPNRPLTPPISFGLLGVPPEQRTPEEQMQIEREWAAFREAHADWERRRDEAHRRAAAMIEPPQQARETAARIVKERLGKK